MITDLTYSQHETINDAFRWILGEMRTSASDGSLTWPQLADLTASAIIARYAAHQRAIVGELTSISTLLTTPLSHTAESMNDSWGRRVRDDLRTAQNTLANAEYLLELLAVVTTVADIRPDLAGATGDDTAPEA